MILFRSASGNRTRSGRSVEELERSITDEELIPHIQAGNSHAFELMVVRYERYVGSLVARYVRKAAVADVVQEVFLKVFREVCQVRTGAAFKGWIRQVAIRSSYDYIRKNSRADGMLCDGEFDGMVLGPVAEQSIRSFELAGSKSEQYRKLHAVLSELSLPERMVLVLVYIEERSVAEVARDLGWSIANVKVRAFRSRQKARRILEQFERRSNEEG